MLFVCYPKCTTCQKARAWLEARGLPAEVRDIKTQNPTEAELRRWHAPQRPAPQAFFQHQRPAVQGPGPEGQAARHERGMSSSPCWPPTVCWSNAPFW